MLGAIGCPVKIESWGSKLSAANAIANFGILRG
jgi:hypothetical protein